VCVAVCVRVRSLLLVQKKHKKNDKTFSNFTFV
jgi:hypothetical protein